MRKKYLDSAFWVKLMFSTLLFLVITFLITTTSNAQFYGTRLTNWNYQGRNITNGYTPELCRMDSFLVNGGVPVSGSYATDGSGSYLSNLYDYNSNEGFLNEILTEQQQTVNKITLLVESATNLGATMYTASGQGTVTIPNNYVIISGYSGTGGTFAKLLNSDIGGESSIEQSILFSIALPNVPLQTYKPLVQSNRTVQCNNTNGCTLFAVQLN